MKTSGAVATLQRLYGAPEGFKSREDVEDESVEKDLNELKDSQPF